MHKFPLIIDEIQYAPELFDEIETIVDEEKVRNDNNYGMFILTGSQMYKLMKHVSDSMAGRVGIIHMLPLSRNEIIAREEPLFDFDLLSIQNRADSNPFEIDDVFKLIVNGFYPELYSNPNLDRETFYSDYIQTYIERDVSEIINIKDKLAFRRFMEVLASLTGEELVYANIAKIIGVNEKTVKEWVSVLISGDIVYLLEPYNEESIAKRVVRRPKIYFTDTGLAAYLARLDSSETLMASAFSGRFIETYIVNEIKKSFLNNGKEPFFYYYRDSNMNEIDLIIINKGYLHRIECKQGINYNKSDVKGFEQVEKSKLKIGTSLIICNTNKIYIIDENVYAIPLSGI